MTFWRVTTGAGEYTLKVTCPNRECFENLVLPIHRRHLDGQVAWLPMRIMREPGYDFNNKKMAESFTEYNMEFGFKILNKHVVVIC